MLVVFMCRPSTMCCSASSLHSLHHYYIADTVAHYLIHTTSTYTTSCSCVYCSSVSTASTVMYSLAVALTTSYTNSMYCVSVSIAATTHYSTNTQRCTAAPTAPCTACITLHSLQLLHLPTHTIHVVVVSVSVCGIYSSQVLTASH